MTSDQLDNTFAALADPTRRAILGRLSEGEASVGELAEPFPISVQAVSRHLKVLEQAGLVSRGRRAQLRPARLEGAARGRGHMARVLPALLGGRLRPPRRPGARCLSPTSRSGVCSMRRASACGANGPSQAFADWFGGTAAEVPVSSVTMDVREEAPWRATMFAGPARQEIHWKGEYREVDEPRLLSFTISDQPDDELADLVTVTLSDLGDGRTEMVMAQSGEHMTPEEYTRAGEGWAGSSTSWRSGWRVRATFPGKRALNGFSEERYEDGQHQQVRSPQRTAKTSSSNGAKATASGTRAKSSSKSGASKPRATAQKRSTPRSQSSQRKSPSSAQRKSTSTQRKRPSPSSQSNNGVVETVKSTAGDVAGKAKVRRWRSERPRQACWAASR